MMRHYQFRQRLIQKAREAGKVLLVVDEAYTSVVDAVTRITLWVVPKSLVAMDRDANAAKNILLRNICY